MVKLFTKHISSISQSVKDLTFRKMKNKAGQVLQKKPIPRNPNSQAQQARRQAYSRLCYLWSANKIEDKDYFINEAKKRRLDKTNLYLQAYLNILSYEPILAVTCSMFTADKLIDLTENANDLTIVGGSIVQTGAGKYVYQGLTAGQYAYIDNNAQFNQRNEFTVIGLLKINDYHNWYNHIHKEIWTTVSSDYDWGIYSDANGKLHFAIRDNTIRVEQDVVINFEKMQWIRVAFRWNGEYITAWVDEQEGEITNKTITYDETKNYAQFRLSDDGGSNSEYMIAAYYNKALTDKQIKSILKSIKFMTNQE